jgi:hypothetical protein
MDYLLLSGLLVFVSLVIASSQPRAGQNYYPEVLGQVAQEDASGAAIENTTGAAIENTTGAAEWEIYP